MKTMKIATLLLVLSGLTFAAYAQKPEGKEEAPKSAMPDANAMMKGMFGGKVDVAESYTFDHNFKMLTESVDHKGRKTEMTMIMFLSESQEIMGMKMEGDEVPMDYTIVDMGKEQMITLMTNDGSKMGMVTKFNDPAAKSNKEDDITYTFEKTGKKEMIAGQMCEEYLVKNSDPKENSKTTVWMAPNGDSAWMDSFRKMAKGKETAWTRAVPGNSYPEGGMVRVVNISENGKTTSTMTVVESNTNQPTTVKTGGYQFMSFGG